MWVGITVGLCCCIFGHPSVEHRFSADVLLERIAALQSEDPYYATLVCMGG